MKCIVKGREPQSLLEHRLKFFADYDNYSEKDELRESLLTEQGHICCYCMQRISVDKMKIEHWKSQDEYSQFKLDFNNLLGACEGGHGAVLDARTYNNPNGGNITFRLCGNSLYP